MSEPTSLGVNPQIREVRCPYTNEMIATVPAINPDVTVLHAQAADRQGNILIRGIVGAQKEAALAATTLIVTVEEIVESLGAPMNAIVLPHWVVTAIAEVPNRCLSLLCAWLLRTGQRFLFGLG